MRFASTRTRNLIACDRPDYDRLVDEFGLQLLPWSATLDIENRLQNIQEPIDANFVSLKFSIGRFAQAMIDRRKQVKEPGGQESGEALGWKLMANRLYGVVGSEHFAAGNAVAANIITATARAAAFAMIQSLNGYLVITDGCTCRRDQIPACTDAECLRLQPDDAIRRAEADGPIPFLDLAEVPTDDTGPPPGLASTPGDFSGSRATRPINYSSSTSHRATAHDHQNHAMRPDIRPERHPGRLANLRGNVEAEFQLIEQIGKAGDVLAEG